VQDRRPRDERELAVGEPGEICARVVSAVPRYLNDHDATHTHRRRRRVTSTPATSGLDARGYLSVTGRLKELIIRGGENISPRPEIESVLVDHRNRPRGVVVGMPDERWARSLRGDPDQRRRRPAGADIVDYVGRRLAPSGACAVVRHDAPALTPTGKVRKFELRDAIMHGQSARDLRMRR